nr:hypothetical protein [Tanacetum cinerariifolium]
MALLSIRADRFWKKTGKKISIQGTDVAGFDKLKVECFYYHKMGHFARECRAPRSQDRGRRDNYRQGSKVEDQAPKALMAIDEVGWNWIYMANDEENHALITNEETPTEFALMAKTSAEKLLKKEKGELETKLTGFHTASKDLDNLLESQRLDKNKEGLGYSVIPPPPAQVYSPLKKDMSWTGLLEKFPTGSTKISTADMGKKENAVKASACWFLKPSQNLSYKGPNSNSNISYLSDYAPFDGGYVSFVQGGCKITGKGTIKTGKLEFKNVYFVKDL